MPRADEPLHIVYDPPAMAQAGVRWELAMETLKNRTTTAHIGMLGRSRIPRPAAQSSRNVPAQPAREATRCRGLESPLALQRCHFVSAFCKDIFAGIRTSWQGWWTDWQNYATEAASVAPSTHAAAVLPACELQGAWRSRPEIT